MIFIIVKSDFLLNFLLKNLFYLTHFAFIFIEEINLFNFLVFVLFFPLKIEIVIGSVPRVISLSSLYVHLIIGRLHYITQYFPLSVQYGSIFLSLNLSIHFNLSLLESQLNLYFNKEDSAI